MKTQPQGAKKESYKRLRKTVKRSRNKYDVKTAMRQKEQNLMIVKDLKGENIKLYLNSLCV